MIPMSIDIRPYKESDFETIKTWWQQHNGIPPQPGMMIEDGTFVVEWSGEPVMTLTVFKTQSTEIAFFEGFCKHPYLPKELSYQFGSNLFEHCYEYLQKNGYKRAILYAEYEALVKRYEALGMTKALSGLTSMTRVL